MDEVVSKEFPTDKSGISKLILPALYILLSIHFIMNLTGLPVLKYFYLFELMFIITCVFFNDFNKAIIPLIALFFIEGQGRILWSYHPVMRNIFDIAISVTILKSISLKKTLFPIHKLPYGLIFLIGLHFLWFALQVFNIDNVGILLVIFTSKIYIFPLFMFFMFLNNPIQIQTLKSLQAFVLFIIIWECILSIYQMNLQEQSVLSLTSYYHRSLKNIFVGINFRPYGTSFAPGAFSVYFFVTIGFLFISEIKSKLTKLLLPLSILITSFSLFIMQVRSAFIKYLLALLLIQIGLFLFTKEKLKTSIKYLITIMALILLVNFLPGIETLFPDINFETSVGRIEALQSSKITDHRSGVDAALEILVQKLIDNPLGLGPGRTGAASGMGSSFIDSDPVYGRDSSWAYDNLLISFVIDLGIGAIFYVLVITILTLKLAYNTILTYRSNNYNQYRIALVSAITCIMILVGNWGAVGLPYNPESFIFWLFMALGLNAGQSIEERQIGDVK